MNPPPINRNAPWLAPLAGYSDLPFRLLCREYGAACAVTEMVSARGLVHYSPGTKDLLATCRDDAPLVVQLFGCEPEMFKRAMDFLLRAGFCWFDLNCGCSVPKVVKTGSGAALLRTPELLLRIVRIMAGMAGPGSVGVKLRTGWEARDRTTLNLAPALEDAGAAWLTLHPRHARQGFAGQAAWGVLAELKSAVGLPVLASGDLLTAADAKRCLEETGADAPMFARGAMHDPTIFNHYLNNAPDGADGAEVAALIRRHAGLIQEHGRADRSLLRMRSIVPRYVRGLAGARAFRMEMAGCSSWEHLEDITGRIALAGPATPPHSATQTPCGQET